MFTDPKTLHDHPAVLLDTEGNRLDSILAHAGMGASMRDAAEHLRDYEKTNGITFAALNNESLAEVKREYDRYVSGQSNALGAAIDSLLGLED